MSMLGTKDAVDTKTRTKQSFKDETDINKLLQRAQKTGTISHLNKHEARYGDFSGFDFFEAQLRLSQGREIFDDLPVELRNEFNNSPEQFFKYVNDPANEGRLHKLLPGLAEPGRQNIDVNGNISADEAAARERAAQPTPPLPPAIPVTEPSGGPDAPPEPNPPPDGGS